MADPATAGNRGRPLSTSRHELERVAFTLFARAGFDATSVEDIAAAAGISRRTFFRYFATKNDVVWGDFDDGLESMREHLSHISHDVPVLIAVRAAVIDFNSFDATEEHRHRQRMALILGVPALYANSALRFAQWRAVIAEYAAHRMVLSADDLAPTLIGYSALGASLSAYEQWLAHPGSRIDGLLAEAFDILGNRLRPIGGAHDTR